MIVANLKLSVIIEPVEEGGYIAFIEEMPNVCTQGETLEEVKENLVDALEMVLEVQKELSQQKQYKSEVIKEELVFA